MKTFIALILLAGVAVAASKTGHRIKAKYSDKGFQSKVACTPTPSPTPRYSYPY